MGSPTPRRSTTGVGVATARIAREDARAVLVSFILIESEADTLSLKCLKRWTPGYRDTSTVPAGASYTMTDASFARTTFNIIIPRC